MHHGKESGREFDALNLILACKSKGVCVHYLMKNMLLLKVLYLQLNCDIVSSLYRLKGNSFPCKMSKEVWYCYHLIRKHYALWIVCMYNNNKFNEVIKKTIFCFIWDHQNNRLWYLVLKITSTTCFDCIFYLHMVSKFRNTSEFYCCLYHLVENMDPVVYNLHSQSYVTTHSQIEKT